MAARAAAERTVDSLGLAAMASNSVLQRDSLLGAQFELNRKLAIFALSFNDGLDASVARAAGGLDQAQPSSPHDITQTNWDALKLVDDHQVELSITGDRFALEIAHACEWEIRELDGYISSLLGLSHTEHERNPLRAELIGQAMVRAIEAVTDRAEVRKVLATELGHALAAAMRQTYADIVAQLRGAGVKPIGLSARRPPRAAALAVAGVGDSGAAALQESRSQQFGRHSQHGSGWDDEADYHRDPRRPPAAGNGRGSGGDASQSRHGGYGGGYAGGYSGGYGNGVRAGFDDTTRGRSGGQSMGQVDPVLMSVIRRLNQGAGHAAHTDDVAQAVARSRTAGQAGWTPAGHGLAAWDEVAEPNLIQVHREELRQAAHSGLDQMVIDVIATLFDHILADAKVPPQMARLIARLQLPVLRAALGDPAFFSARRHPVRRLINRIASLASASDDLASAEGQALLQRVQELIQQIVDGDLEQLDTYAKALASLESFVAEQAQIHANGQAEELLARKEVQLAQQQRFAQELDSALANLPMADYLREFIAQTWSRVIASAEQAHGLDSAQVQRMRAAGRELVMSVQPKGLPAQRKVFLQQLPQLMKDLNQGMDQIRWPDEDRRTFFSKLLPAHAESLRGQPMTTLEHNLLARRIDTALATPLPNLADLPPVTATVRAPGETPADVPVVFTPAEAQAVGLIEESAIDWRAPVDIDIAAEPEISAADLAVDGMPAPEPVEPSCGLSLADHVQIGFAYQMHLAGQWRKVRLTHVSAGRSFFVFTHGAKQRSTVSVTYRMLSRLCETRRLRAFESAFLLERATARARRQLAQLRPAA